MFCHHDGLPYFGPIYRPPPRSQRRHLPPRPISRLCPRRLTLALAGWRKGGRRLGAALCAPPGGFATGRRGAGAALGLRSLRSPGRLSPVGATSGGRLATPPRPPPPAPMGRTAAAPHLRLGREGGRRRCRASEGGGGGSEGEGLSGSPPPALARGGRVRRGWRRRLLEGRGGAGGGGGEGEGERPLPLVLIVDLRLRIYGRTLGFPRQAGRSGAPAPSQRGGGSAPACLFRRRGRAGPGDDHRADRPPGRAAVALGALLAGFLRVAPGPLPLWENGRAGRPLKEKVDGRVCSGICPLPLRAQAARLGRSLRAPLSGRCSDARSLARPAA